MYSADRIIAAFSGLVGFQQNVDPQGAQIKYPELLQSDSGVLVQTQHPELTVNNLSAIAPRFDNFTYNNWDASTEYKKGNVVSNADENWIAKRDNTNVEPTESSTDDWRLFDGFSEWLLTRYNQAVIESMQSWYETKSGLKTAKSVMQRKVLFPRHYKEFYRDVNNGDNVGLNIYVPNSSSLAATIHKVSFHFDGAENFTLSLRRSDRPNAVVKTFQVNYDTPGDVKWFDLEGFDLEGGPQWFLGYNQSDVNSQSLSPTFLRDKGCFFGGKYLVAQPYVGEFGGNIAISRNSSPFGMNVLASVYCDYSGFLIEQKSSFSNLVAKRYSMMLLHEIVRNPNDHTNRYASNDANERMELIFELTGEAKGRPSGLAYEYKKALDSVMFDKELIDSVCLPCKSTGFRMRTI